MCFNFYYLTAFSEYMDNLRHLSQGVIEIKKKKTHLFSTATYSFQCWKVLSSFITFIDNTLCFAPYVL